MDFENFDCCNNGNSVYENAMRKIEEAKRYKPKCCCLQGPTGPTGPSGGPTGPTAPPLRGNICK